MRCTIQSFIRQEGARVALLLDLADTKKKWVHTQHTKQPKYNKTRNTPPLSHTHALSINKLILRKSAPLFPCPGFAHTRMRKCDKNIFICTAKAAGKAARKRRAPKTCVSWCYVRMLSPTRLHGDRVLLHFDSTDTHSTQTQDTKGEMEWSVLCTGWMGGFMIMLARSLARHASW